MCDSTLIGAKAYFQKNLERSEELLKISPTPQAYDDLAISYIRLGEIGERDLYKKAYNIYKMLATKFPANPRYSKYRDMLENDI